MMMNFVIFSVSVGICFYHNIMLGYLALVFIPIAGLSAAIAMIFIGGYNDKSLY